MTSAFSWQNSISLCPASFHIPRPNLLLLQVFLDFLLLHSIPYNEKDIFWGCQFQKVLQVCIEPFNFTFFSVTCRGIDLDYRDSEWFALEMNRHHSVIFETHTSTAFWTLLLTMMDTPFLLRDSCPQQQIQWSSELSISLNSRLLMDIKLFLVFCDYQQCSQK